MHIIDILIKNFRGIKNLQFTFGDKHIVCIVGEGDSGKSTVLEAISLALAPSWNISFNDNDFYLKNVSDPIEIEVSVKVPKDFILESKYGLYMRFWDNKNKVIQDEPNENFEKVLTIKLIVSESLEPKWYVYNKCQEDNFKEISQNDRAKFNCLMIADYIDRHFTWNSGSPLYSLLSSNKNINKSNYIEPLRQALYDINKSDFKNFNECFNEKIDSKLLDLKDTKTFMDAKDIYSNSNKLSIHDKNGIPYRLKGKGTKRLLSTTLQLADINNGAITVIDEIEQGLEPYRIKNLIALLKTKQHNQVFLSTHSIHVITELDADDIYVLRKENEKHQLKNVSNELQKIIRQFPEVLFSKKIIICEGKTELGLCKAIDYSRIQNDESPMSYYGCIPICGEGSNFYEYCEMLNSLEYQLLVFCDSDLKDDNKKEELKKSNITISDCEKGNCVEKQIFKDLNIESIKKLIDYAIKKHYHESNEAFVDSIKSKYSNFPKNWKDTDLDNQDCREALASASVIKGSDKSNTSTKSNWFKSETGGLILGKIIFDNYEDINENVCIKKQTETITKWITQE